MRRRTAHCVFAVRAFVAKCPKCDETLENPEGECEFNEVEAPVRIGSVVVCQGCRQYVRITDPNIVFRRRLRGDAQGEAMFEGP